jgi:predicted metal-binding protein
MILARGPQMHFFVCANARAKDHPLGEGCAERGEAVFQTMKRETLAGGTGAWVTKTGCMGVCPKQGSSIVRTKNGSYELFTEVLPEDALRLLRDR